MEIPLKITRRKDGSLTLSSPNGKARISRTPPGAKEPPIRDWTLEINGKVHDTYHTQERAITAAKEILALKPRRKKSGKKKRSPLK